MVGKVAQFEEKLESNRKELLENRRDLQMIESDMNRFHRQQLIENLTTLSVIMDQINDFEKIFRRMANEER